MKAFTEPIPPKVVRTLRSQVVKMETLTVVKENHLETKPIKVDNFSKSNFNSDDLYMDMDLDPNEARLSMGFRARFHTARPWQKHIEVTSFKRNTTESSEEEMDHVWNFYNYT